MGLFSKSVERKAFERNEAMAIIADVKEWAVSEYKYLTSISGKVTGEMELGALIDIVNFDFAGFVNPDQYVQSVEALKAIFTSKEECRLSNRLIHLGIILDMQYGSDAVDRLVEEFKRSLERQYDYSSTTAEAIANLFPCIWMIPIISSAILVSTKHG